jgi:hypothetical protein
MADDPAGPHATMERNMSRSRPGALSLAAVLISAAGGTAALAQTKEIVELGRQEYRWNCEVCHGKEGRGDGTMASVLTKPPADLTKLAQRNQDRFPFWRVYSVIGGQASVLGHQAFEMPEFWRRFRREEGQSAILPAEMRILVLTHYVESLQK